MSFKHLKVGDRVYLVPQSKRSNIANYVEVVKVGRKYGYVLTGWRSERFDLLTGQSVHINSNTRWTGRGFNIWPSKEAHDAHIAELEERKRLCVDYVFK